MNPAFTAAWTLFTGLLVLLLPGLAWQAFFWDPDQDFFERLAEVLGMSIALTALGALIFFYLGWQLSIGYLIALYLTSAVPAGWGLWKRWQAGDWIPITSDQPAGDPPQPGEAPPGEVEGPREIQGRLVGVILGLIFIAVLLWRFYQIQEVVLPLWVDSIHHVQIVNLFLENGSVPASFEPYMPVPFYYHYAFHVITAVFSALSRLSSATAVLYLGQVLNAAIALAVYRLGKALWGDWRRGALSAILVGFATQMPAYYVTWGRYTLLTGMFLLALAMAAALDVVNKGAARSRIFTFGLLTTGILLSHYFAAALLAIFLIILGIQVLVGNLHSRKTPVWHTWLPLFIGALAGLITAGPWLFRMWGFAQGGVELVAFQPTMEAVSELYFPDYLTYLWRLLGPVRNQVLLFAALPGLVISLLRPRTRAFGTWTLVLALLSLPAGFYVAPFRPDHAVIVLFLPMALLLSELLVSFIDWTPIEKISLIKVFGVLAVFSAGVAWGIFETRNVINSSTVLATSDDLEALYWLAEHTPEEARFGINVTHWQYGSYRGVDGGWWITPLTGRMTLLPNGLYAMGGPDYARRVNLAASQFSDISGCTQEFWDIVQSEGLTHLYISADQGSLQPAQLENCDGVELIFNHKDVYVYQIEYIINPDE